MGSHAVEAFSRPILPSAGGIAVKNPIAEKLREQAQYLLQQADLLETTMSVTETELDAAAFRELLSRIATSCPLDWEDEESCPFGKDEDACWEEQRRGGFDYKDCYRALYRALAAKAHPQEEN